MTRNARAMWLGLVVAVAAVGVWLLLRDGDAGDAGRTTATEAEGRRPREAGNELRGRADERTKPNDEARTLARDVRVALPDQLRGRVTDEHGRPLAASVVVTKIDVRSLRGTDYPDVPLEDGSTSCDADGLFELPAPSATMLRVTAMLDGYARHAVRVASRSAFAEIRMAPACVMHVTVVGMNTGQAGITVKQGNTVSAYSTNDKGSAEIRDLAPGTATIDVRSKSHGHGTAGPIALSPAAPSHVVVELSALMPLDGVVLDSVSMKPIAGALISVTKNGQVEGPVPSNADGTFSVEALGAERTKVYVTAAAKGYRPKLQTINLMGSEGETGSSNRTSSHRTVVLMESGEDWTGSVFDDGGNPLVGAIVRYTESGAAGSPAASTMTDEQGQFTLPPPPDPMPGRRVLLAALDPRSGARAALALRPHAVKPHPLVLKLASGAAVAGRVVGADGKPLNGAQIRLVPNWGKLLKEPPTSSLDSLRLANEQGFIGLSTASDANGSWRLQGVPLASYRLNLQWSSGQHWMPTPIEVTADDLYVGVVQVRETHALRGRVVDGNGNDVAGAKVIAMGANPDQRQSYAETSLSDGTFAIRGIAHGPYRVRARMGPRSSPQVEINSETQSELTLTLPSGATLELNLRTSKGPYNGTAHVAFAGPTRSRAGIRQSVLVKQGRAVLTDLPPGTWTLDLTTRDGLGARRDVQLGEGANDRVDLELTPRTTLNGVLVGPQGEPEADADIELRSTRGSITVATGAGGTFTFFDLAPGRYQLKARGRTGSPMEQSITLTGINDRPLKLELGAASSLRVLVLDEKDKPVKGASCMFALDGNVVRGRRPDRTDRKGEVVRGGLPLGLIDVRARTPDGKVGLARAEVSAGKINSVTVYVEARSASTGSPR